MHAAFEPEKRYQHASDVKTRVDEIRGISMSAVHQAFGKEYRSKINFFGIPLIHIASGFDPRTGRNRVCRCVRFHRE